MEIGDALEDAFALLGGKAIGGAGRRGRTAMAAAQGTLSRHFECDDPRKPDRIAGGIGMGMAVRHGRRIRAAVLAE